MTGGRRSGRAGGSVVAVCLVAGLLGACAETTRSVPDPAAGAGGPAREPLEAEHRRLQERYGNLEQEHERLQIEYRRLATEHRAVARQQQELAEDRKRQSAATEQSEERLARLQLQLFEKDLQIKLLTEKLDAAILEVVRAMAKLRGLESKAEAASNLAEAEVALKLHQRAAGSGERSRDAGQAEQLLKMAAEEFKKENYGGALYLAGQTKSLLKRPQTGSAGEERLPALQGEVAFALPLALKVLTRSQVREGPGTQFKAAYTVEPGTRLTGHSYQGTWVRVRRGDGRPGWILYNVVGAP